MSGILKSSDMEDHEGHTQRGQGDSIIEARSLGNGQHSRPQSPLKFFAQAKKTINDVFKEILEYINESKLFLTGIKFNNFNYRQMCMLNLIVSALIFHRIYSCRDQPSDMNNTNLIV